ncbi:teashirt homolog 1-like [Engraulis encrasicolus]|uniref:teashirt homolog 1-like n=1 Tax=Engraulis encrasicolus TaxID=184585 RepID=UPI002FD7401B
MPRRKQQAPRRASAYGPEDEFKAGNPDEEEHLQDDGLSLDGQDTDYPYTEEEDGHHADHDLNHDHDHDHDHDQLSYQNSPLSNGTNPDPGYGSPLSDGSEQLLADFRSTSSKDGGQDKDGGVEDMEGMEASAAAGVAAVGAGMSLQDSLAQMKAIYANLISDASWSSISQDIMKNMQMAVAAGENCTSGGSGSSSNSVASSIKESTSAAAAVASAVGKSSASTSSSSSTPSNTTPTTTATTAAAAAAASAAAAAAAATSVSPTPNNISGNVTANASGAGGGIAYDWHQAALAKTLQHTPYHLLPEPSLFSTVQLYRQNNKLFGPVFTGASKFRCKDCSGAYDTLVGLTVHMNETGHYRDNNKDKEEDHGKKWSKPRKRSLMEMEGKEDAQKVLKCMYCGHSFESLQDLSVHMIKTKHYQKVPLKEPMPALATKLLPPTKKRVFQDLVVSPCSPEPVPTGTPGIPLAESSKDQKIANPYVTPNNRYGYQNGASYTWQFEARKAQILKCMECGSSHDTLQQLTAHMMVTGHFLKVTNTASKKGKQLVFDPVIEEKIQSIPLPPTTTRLPAPTLKSRPDSPPKQPPHTPKTEERKEKLEEMTDMTNEVEKKPVTEKKIKEEKEDDPTDRPEKTVKTGSFKYLREEDLEDSPREGLDILKSLENTVSCAINKAQTGTPTWGGYPSIHAAYQLQGTMKPSLSAVQSVQMKPTFSATSLKSLASDMNNPIHSPCSPSPPLNHKSNVLAMEELVEKVTGKIPPKKERETKPSDTKSNASSAKPSPVAVPTDKKPAIPSEDFVKPLKNGTLDKPKREQPTPPPLPPPSRGDEGRKETHASSVIKNGAEAAKPPIKNGCSGMGIITDQSPEQPFINPLSALQSIMNSHLGKASKVVSPLLDPLAMLYKISNNMMDSPIYSNNNSSNPTQPEQQRDLNSSSQFSDCDDQPMDLTKSKSSNGHNSNGTPTVITNSNTNNNNNNNNCKFNNNNNSISMKTNSQPMIADLISEVSSPLRENALMDISDMVKNLSGHITPKSSSTPSSISEKSDVDVSAFEDTLEELTPIQRRKGRQSNWNPQHLLILQAQFASSLRETPEGKFVITDLGPQERVHICKFTGLSMTTISHWLANVKYQLRRSGGTKFLKNIDSGQPLFLCSDCASQFRTPSSYISHLESHLGFSLKDLSKLSLDIMREEQAVAKIITDKTFGALGLSEEDANGIYQCKLCNRTFVSKHAVKLHLSKSHGKSPEDHLIFVTELEKLEKA